MNPFDLIDKLDQKRLNDQKNKNKFGRVSFLEWKDQIQAALDKGYTAKDIWKELKNSDQLKISYVTFSVYVKEYIGSKKEETKRDSIRKTKKRQDTENADQSGETIDKKKDLHHDVEAAKRWI